MIILSVGMPRAGSGWYYNLMHDLVVADGGKESRKIRDQYHLEKILTEVNYNIGALTLRRLSAVLVPSWKGERFVIKAHAGPTLAGNLVEALGWMKPTYLYRDPRDALLSAMDFGKRTLDQGHPNAFSHLTDLDKAIDFMLGYCQIWDGWMKKSNILQARYEDLLSNYDVEVQRLMNYLEIPPSQKQVDAIVEKYRPGKAREGRDGLHFFKGQVGRFRERFDASEQQKMAEMFAPYLKRMGCEI
jgi:hypothetical protein